MTKKVWLVLTVVLLSVVMVLGACSKNDNDSNKGGTTPAETPKTEAPAQEVDINAPYSPAIEISTVRPIPDPSIVKYPEGDSLENNVWTRTLEEELGIKVKYLWTTDSAQYEQRLNLTLSSNSLPDFMLVSGQQFRQLYDAGQLQDMTEVFEKYASDNVKQVFAEGGPQDMEMAKIDGKLMALPQIAMAKEAAKGILWVRTDWLEELGLPEPKTMDDVLRISEAFAKQDPDRNGQDDTLGFALDNSLLWAEGFFNSYHAYPDIWIKGDDGKLKFGSIQPEMKAPLEALQKMYLNGEIDREFLTKTFFDVYQPLGAGVHGLAYGSYWISIAPLQTIRDQNPKAEWKPFPLISVDGKPALAQHGSGVSGYLVVNKNAKNPEAVVKLLNFWYDKFYFNSSMEDYKKFIHGDEFVSIYMNSPVLSYRAFNNLEITERLVAVLEGKLQESELTPVQIDLYNNVKKFIDGDEAMWGWNKAHGPDSAIYVIKDYEEQGRLIMNEFYGAATETMAQRSTTLKSRQDEAFVKIIMGDPIENFDKFVEEWKRLGGDDITREVNEWYEANQ